MGEKGKLAHRSKAPEVGIILGAVLGTPHKNEQKTVLPSFRRKPLQGSDNLTRRPPPHLLKSFSGNDFAIFLGDPMPFLYFFDATIFPFKRPISSASFRTN